MELLGKLLEDDTKRCYGAIKADTELAELDKEFYTMLDQMERTDGLKLEGLFSRYMARVTRIAYLQGMKDFMELCVELKGNVQEIQNK